MTIGSMATANEILEQLTTRASTFEFPTLSNSSFAVLAARLRGFSKGRDWALIFEWLGFSEQELAFPLDLYCYGSVFADGFVLRQVEGIELDPETWAADSSWQPLEPIKFRISERQACASSKREVSCEVGLDEADLENEVVFGHAVVRELGYAAVLDRGRLLNACPEVRGYRELFSLCDWDHPDISRGETVAQSAALQSCARVLSHEAESVGHEYAFDSLRARAIARRCI